MGSRLLLSCALGLMLTVAALSTAHAGDIYVPGDYTTIQAAIDAATSGDAIHVAAGTYREQLKIDGKDLDLVGAGIGSSIVEAVDIGDRTTYSITQWNASTKTIDPVIGVVGPCTVNISGFTVDGRTLGQADFYGIHYFDAGGSITECRIEDILHSTSPGAQSVVSVVATHSADAGSYSIEFSDNVIPNFQKGGFVVMGPQYSFVAEDNVITNAPTPYNAGNGMQLSYGATGTTARNNISGVGYEGEDWTATGILLMESGDVDMDSDVVHDCQTGISYSDWHWVYTNTVPVDVSVTGLDLYDNGWAFVNHLAEDDCDLNLTMTDCSFHDNTGDGLDLWGDTVDPWGGSYYTGWNNGDLNVTIEGCAFLNTTGYDGIWADDDSGNANNVDCDISGCSFSGNYEAAIWNSLADTIVAENCWWGDPAGPTVLRGGSGTRGGAPMASPFGAALPEQGRSWERETNVSRAGDGVYGLVDFDPFLTGNIVCDPDPEYLTDGDPTKTIEVKYLGGASAPLYGYSINFSWDGDVVSTSEAHVAEGTILTDLGTTFFWVEPGSDEITIDSALLGALDGATGPGVLFTVEFTGLAVGTSDIDITVIYARDRYNVPLTGIVVDDGLLVVDIDVPTVTDVEIENLTLGHTDDYIKNTDAARVTATVLDDDAGFDAGNITANLTGLGGGAAVNPDSYNPGTGEAVWTTAITSVTCSPANGTVTVTVSAVDDIGNVATPGSDTIISDNIAPTAITGFDAAPAHNEAVLSWNDPTVTDANFYEVHIQSNAWGDYPTYTGGGPAYPADQDDGTDVWEGPGTGYTVVYAADGTERDIHYYQAFASDWVLHYGPADAGARDRCTNYWLGDVAEAMGVWGSNPTTPFNGLVNDADIDLLGGTYFVTSPAWPDNQCDVGPTDDYSRVGIPLPDDAIGFEDLMIFAMNYYVVSPRIVPLLDEPSDGELMVTLEEMQPEDGTVDVALGLTGNRGEVKGLTATVTYDTRELEFVSARAADEVHSPLARVFFWQAGGDGRVHVDLAVLGTDMTIGGSGNVAVLKFRALADAYELGFDRVALRGAGNENLEAGHEGLESKPEIPSVFRLVQNAPNPFNPSTKIAYDIPHESDVAIRIYDVSGRLVRTLVDGAAEPGRHAVRWDGVGDGGEPVGSGVYFCVMEAGGFTDSSKMMLLK